MNASILLELLERINVLEQRVAKLTLTLEEQEEPLPWAIADVHENSDHETVIQMDDEAYQKWLYDE